MVIGGGSMLGTWRAREGDFPLMTLRKGQHVVFHSPNSPEDYSHGEWRIENGDTLVLVFEIEPDPDSDNEELREGTKEVMRFRVLECTDNEMTLEDEDGHDDIQFERVAT
jgi:hypothetical protein